ncbi:MAG: isoprenylcysteine carboxylmethyltransferase family protein [Hyphomicrobiaceae bacterium]
MSDPTSTDRANRVPWPPIIDVVALAGALTLDRLVPLPALIFEGWQIWGLLIAAAGLGIAVLGLGAFQRARTTFVPNRPATALATGGIYKVTRNPMYLGVLVLFVGLGLAIKSGWLLVAVPLVAYALQKLAIEREEAYLTRRFGEAYLAYCAKVRRWV